MIDTIEIELVKQTASPVMLLSRLKSANPISLRLLTKYASIDLNTRQECLGYTLTQIAALWAILHSLLRINGIRLFRQTGKLTVLKGKVRK